MQLVFNELSEIPLCNNKSEAYERVEKFVATYKASHRFGFNIIRCQHGIDTIQLADDYTLGDYCNEPKFSRTVGTLLRGLFRAPYIEENSDEENFYIENDFALQKEGKTIKPYGLAAAYIYSTVSIGFLSDDFWQQPVFELMIYPSESIHEVYCLSKKEHLEDIKVIGFIENKQPILLIESDIAPKDKKCELRNDHGKDVLTRFSKLIFQSKYVESVINSMPFNRFERNFIRRIYPDGKIEIVLTKTDQGLGMIVQTTGRNLRETTEIARILESKFRNWP